MIFKECGKKAAQLIFCKFLIKIRGQLQNHKKIDSFGAHEAERVDSHKETAANMPPGMGS